MATMQFDEMKKTPKVTTATITLAANQYIRCIFNLLIKTCIYLHRKKLNPLVMMPLFRSHRKLFTRAYSINASKKHTATHKKTGLKLDS